MFDPALIPKATEHYKEEKKDITFVQESSCSWNNIAISKFGQFLNFIILNSDSWYR